MTFQLYSTMVHWKLRLSSIGAVVLSTGMLACTGNATETAAATEDANAAATSDECAHADETRAIQDRVEKAIEAARVADKIPGIAYSAFNKRCVFFSGSSGAANIEGTQPLSPQRTLFRMASVSKLFATVAASQLIEQRLLDPDASLMDLDRAEFVRALRRDPDPVRRANWARIKVRHLMSHQAGISKDLPGTLVFFNSEGIEDHAYPSMRDFYAGLGDVEFLYTPGEVTSGLKYSNLGMNILARLVEAYNRQGLPYAEYVRRNILRRADMTRTFYDLNGAERENLAGGYGNLLADGSRLTLPKVYRTGSYDGSIGVASTAKDLSRFGRRLLALSYFEDNELLRSPNVIRDLMLPKSFLSNTMAWASGPLWQALPGETLDHPLWMGHTGTGYGERTFVMVAPERDLGVVLLFNAADANREKYAKIVADAFPVSNPSLSPATKELLGKVREFLRNVRPLTPTNPAPTERAKLERFAGTYFADVVGNKDVTIVDDAYLSFFGHKLIVEDLESGRFRFPRTGGVLFDSEPIRFELDASGSVKGMRVAQVKHFERVAP